MQVVDHLEKGECQVNIGAYLKWPTSTICTILKNKEKLKTATYAKKIPRSRCYILEEMEKQLSIGIDDKIECNIPLSQAVIMEKARSIYGRIQWQSPDVTKNFSASRGCVDPFKKRNNLKITIEAASADTETDVVFPATLKDIVERGNYPPELVFNIDEDCSGSECQAAPLFHLRQSEHRGSKQPKTD
ncbi:tigger transposable element-derived protein 1-like [Discoglossus pictus]